MKKNILKIFLLTSFITVFLFSVFLVLVYSYYTSDLPDLRDITGYQPSLVNEIYSSDGKLLSQFGLERRKLLDLEEIPVHVTNAFIAVEDKRFFEHSGLDLKGILRAIIQNVKERGYVSGGSTITQQVTKNLVLSPERTLSRKIKEAILAYRIEKNLSKEEILYLYLNHIYLADGTYGIEAASKNYFDKSTNDLNIAEAALLAGIPKRPEHYSPRRNLERALQRQKLILKIMLQEKFISRNEYEDAKNYDISITPKNDINNQVAPYFVEFVRQYLEKKVGQRAYKLGGYKVITTIDIDNSLAAHWSVRNGIYNYEERRGNRFVLGNINNSKKLNNTLNKQRILELHKGNIYEAAIKSVKELKEHVYSANLSISDFDGNFEYVVASNSEVAIKSLNFPLSDKYLPLNGYNGIYVAPKNLKKGDIIKVKVLDIDENSIKVAPAFNHKAQAALASIDSSGNVLAMVGGFNFSNSQFNRVTQAHRQPGSSFKPLVYSAAIDKGYTETSILFDVPVSIKNWEPKNYDGSYHGAIVLREAIAKSRNLATIRMHMDIGPHYVADYSKKFKFKSKLNPYPSLALGSSDVTLLEMVSAFNVFANGGQWVEPRFILRMYDRNDAIIEDNTGKYFIKNEKFLVDERNKERQEILEKLANERGRALSQKKEFISEKEFYDSNSIPKNENNFLTADEFIDLINKNPIAFGPSKNPERIISSDTTYIVTDLLKAVISQGTGKRALALTHLAPLAGKTGTTNDYTDAWFVGYSPKITTGVWVGKDNHTSLGRKESGSRAALPIWMDYMKKSLSETKFKGGEFRKPESIRIIETPYGRIPYRLASLPTLRQNILESLRAEVEKDKSEENREQPINNISINDIQDVLSDEAEIDFLLRR